MDILHGIETKALAVRASQPVGVVMDIADTATDIELPMHASSVAQRLVVRKTLCIYKILIFGWQNLVIISSGK